MARLKQRVFACLLAAAAVLAIQSSGRAETAPAPQEPLFKLFDPGRQEIVDYSSYGEFTGVGTAQYRYLIRDREGLARAVGEGIYPNITALLKDPDFQKAQYTTHFEGNPWDYTNSEKVQEAFFRWAADKKEPPGIKQFFIGQLLEQAGLIRQAIKAYYAVVIHFPKASSMTFWKTPWYVGPTALDRVDWLTREHPELNMHLDGARVRVRNGFDDDAMNDVFEVRPGKLSPGPVQLQRSDLSKIAVKQQIGEGAVKLVQFDNGHWQMRVDSQPYIIRGISYSATPVGKSPDLANWIPHKDWMLSDLNKNNKIDGPYESWVDENRNGSQDGSEKTVGDFKLLQDMGVNTVRLYHHGFNKGLLDDLYKTYGIRVMMGDFLGAYTVGSGADWYAGTDYDNADQKKKMLDSVREMVEAYKDEPYILFWVLGNENIYGNANNARQIPDAYYKFVDEAAKLIKSLDPKHPVSICNGDLLFLDKIARLCPHVDILGINAYRGSDGFGYSFWHNVMDVWGKPVFISEFGCPAFDRYRSSPKAEEEQAIFLANQWRDIEFNLGGGPGAGNGIGGILFEWLDEWWKAGPPPQYDPGVHDTTGQFGGPFPDGWSYEEWYGIAGQGNGKNSPFVRQLRKTYYEFKDLLWNAKKLQERGIPG
jgi:hypothetical protein